MALKRKVLGVEASGKEVLLPPDDGADVTVKKVRVEPKVKVLEEEAMVEVLPKVEAKVNDEVVKEKDEVLEEGVNPADKTEEDEDEEGPGMDIDEDGALDYEEVKRRNVELNRKRLEELGLFDARIQLSSAHRTMSHVKAALKANRRTSSIKCQMQVGFQPRRSLRLVGSFVPSFRVKDLFRSKGEPRDRRARSSGRRGKLEWKVIEGEVYTEEHVKALGSYEKEWELSRDGYERGKRIYDPERGKTCHQCRQKTLGQRTSCSSCKARCGEFCGDCLFQRYGENVLEAKAKPDWICPVCRGICNCSICRVRRGWAPTGCIYRNVLAQGYKSVAHYLILTRRKKLANDSEQGQGNSGGQSANEGELVIGEGNDGENRLDEATKSDADDYNLEHSTLPPNMQPSTPPPSGRIPRSVSKVDSCSAVDGHKAERRFKSKLPLWARQLGIKGEDEEMPSVRLSPHLKKKTEEPIDEYLGSPGQSLESPSMLVHTCPPLRSKRFYETKKSLFLTKETTVGTTPLVKASTRHHIQESKLPGRTKSEVARQRLLLKSERDLAPLLELPCRVEPMSNRLRKKEIINYKSFL